MYQLVLPVLIEGDRHPVAGGLDSKPAKENAVELGKTCFRGRIGPSEKLADLTNHSLNLLRSMSFLKGKEGHCYRGPIQRARSILVIAGGCCFS